MFRGGGQRDYSGAQQDGMAWVTNPYLSVLGGEVGGGTKVAKFVWIVLRRRRFDEDEGDTALVICWYSDRWEIW